MPTEPVRTRADGATAMLQGLLRALRQGLRSDSAARRQRACRPAVACLEPRELNAIGQVTATVTPRILFPPNGRFVTVSVTGTVIATSTEPKMFFAVTDEYRQFEPRARIHPVKVETNKWAFAFTVPLQARASQRVPDGRHYDILVAAGDADNGNGATVGVLVPKNLAQFQQLLRQLSRPPATTRRGVRIR